MWRPGLAAAALWMAASSSACGRRDREVGADQGARAETPAAELHDAPRAPAARLRDAPRGSTERALWALQAQLAAAGAPLRAGPARLEPGSARPDARPVRVRFAPAGPTWTARLADCRPPRESDCAGHSEAGACECAVLVLEAPGEQRSLVVSESAALGRTRLEVLPRPSGAAGLWLAADLFDRAARWPRVGFLIEGAPPRLVWREEIGGCESQTHEDPEEERAPTRCTDAETSVHYAPDDAVVIALPAGPRTIRPRR